MCRYSLVSKRKARVIDRSSVIAALSLSLLPRGRTLTAALIHTVNRLPVQSVDRAGHSSRRQNEQ